MFRSAATKIAHNTTIPALAGHSDLRPLQDLITAEKTVLTTLQKLRVDITKAADVLRIWGQGEGDDLGDVLAASATVLVHFATALSTYSSLHHTIRDSMKSVRTREESLDDLRRRRRRVGASADAAEKKLHKMSPEHKNLATQTDLLNKLRDEMWALDAEIVREEAELVDYKRKCTRDWMSFKFGGLVECCEKGVIVGDVGRRIIQYIPEDVTQPGLPRAYYNAHSHVGNLVAEAQQAVSQVTFSGGLSAHVSTSAPISQPPASTPQAAPAQSPFLPTPSLGSELTLGVATYSLPPGPPRNRRGSADELGMHAPSVHAASQFSSLPMNKGRDVIQTMSVGPEQPQGLSTQYGSGVTPTEEDLSLMASIADALSQNQGEEVTSFGHPGLAVPKYEAIAGGGLGLSARSELHQTTNGHANLPPVTEERQATLRSPLPPCLPPGAAPAAIRAWDDRTGQGEDGAHSDHPASSSADVHPQRITFSSKRDGEDEEGLAYDRDSRSFERGGDGGDGGHHEEETLSESRGAANVDAITATNKEQVTTPVEASVSTGALIDAGGSTALSRTASQWRIPRVPPPSLDADGSEIGQPAAHQHHSPGVHEDEIRTDESADERARSTAAAREISREMDVLVFSAIAPPSTSSGHATPRMYGSNLSAQSQATAPYPHLSAPSQTLSGRTPSPILPPNPPFASQGRDGPLPVVETRYPGRTSSESLSGRPPVLVPIVTTSVAGGAGAGSPTSPKSIYRSSPPEHPRRTPPFSSPLTASSSTSLNGGTTVPAGGPRTISASAFRRQQMRSPSGTELGPADASALSVKKPSVSHSSSPSVSRQHQRAGVQLPAPVAVNKDSRRARLSIVNPDPPASDEEEGLDYIKARDGESAGYGAGRYVSDLEMHG